MPYTTVTTSETERDAPKNEFDLQYRNQLRDPPPNLLFNTHLPIPLGIRHDEGILPRYPIPPLRWSRH